MRSPVMMTKAATNRDTRMEGLFMGDHSAVEGKPHRTSRSSNRRLTSNRRSTMATIQANTTEISSATMRATKPGSSRANAVMNRAVD